MITTQIYNIISKDLLAVLICVLVFQHGKIAGVPALGNAMLLNSLKHSTARLIGMGTVTKTAFLPNLEYLSEVMRHLCLFHIERTKPLDAWSVNYCPVEHWLLAIDHWWQVIHLGEGGGVHASIVGKADFGCLDISVWDELVQYGTLPHSAVAA